MNIEEKTNVITGDESAAAADNLLRNADWSGFDAERDLLPLRRALSALESREGVTDAHLLATRRLREGGALLRHPDVHRAELTGHALSPDGRYLAVGSETGEDYDRGGIIQIWELATGRCVNVLDGIPGYVGWPTHAGDLQWSGDGRVLAANFMGSGVGQWDPFGGQVDPPLAEVDFRADIASREPVGFALDPDGSRIFLHYSQEDTNEDSGVRGCLVGWHPDDRAPDPEELTDATAELVESLNGAAMRPFVSKFSADGSRIWGFGEWEWEDDEDIERQSGAFAIDVDSRRLSWFVDTRFEGLDDFDRMDVDPDETIMALNHGKTLDFIDAATGERLAGTDMPFDKACLRWGQHGTTRRLAVVDTRAKTAEGVRVFDGTRHRYDLPVRPKRPGYDFPDGCTWAWAADGIRAACLTADNRVEIWELADDPRRIGAYVAPADSLGVWWGADDILVIGGPHSLAFHDLNSGKTLGDFRFNREIPKQRPLCRGYADLGADLLPNPTFAIDDETWAASFAEGVVIAPDGRTSELDDLLAWSVDRRHAWPYRWGEAGVVPNVTAAFDRLNPETQVHVESLLDADDAPGPAAWPPPNAANLDDLFAEVADSMAEVDDRWGLHAADTLRIAARQRARLGQLEDAEDLIFEMPASYYHEQTRALAEVALILATNGNRDAAAGFYDQAVSAISSDLSQHHWPFIGSALGAVADLLDRSEADGWIELAIEAIEPTPNPWQHRLSVCWALLEGGLESRARSLWETGEDNQPFHRDSWLAHLLRIGRDDLAREFVFGSAISWFGEHDACNVFAALGRQDLLREALEYHDRTIAGGEQYFEAAARNAGSGRPTPADLVDLRAAHDTLLRAPQSVRRAGTKRLVWRAAACGHYGAVLDLLRRLPNENFNDRPATAARALWIAVSGFDGAPW